MTFMEQMLQTVPGDIVPVPVDYAAPELVGWLYTIWAGGFGVAVIPWVLYRWFKKKDDVPLLFCLGGLIASLLEPMLDHLGHLHWPTNLPGPAFIGYNLNVPYLMVPVYVFFMSVTGYWAYLQMKKGMTVKSFFVLWLMLSATDLILEIPGTLAGAYRYYGDPSFKILGFPLAWSWLAGTAMMALGFVLWLVEPHLKGMDRLCIVLVPVTAMAASYSMTGWPYFMSLNWDLPWIATRLLTVLSLVISLMCLRFMAAVVCKRAGVLARHV